MHIARTFFFFNDTATTEIYTLSLHDALPILNTSLILVVTKLLNKIMIVLNCDFYFLKLTGSRHEIGRATSELQSPVPISYAVFCLKKKTEQSQVSRRTSNSLTTLTSIYLTPSLFFSYF